MHLGGGRATKDSEIDLSVGLVLHKKVGDAVAAGESLASIHAKDEASAMQAAEQQAAREALRLFGDSTEDIPL